MPKKYFIAALAAVGLCLVANLAAAGDIGYRFKPSTFNLKSKALPTSGIVFADAVVGKPLGLATTIAGTGIYIATLPLTLPSGGAGEAGWQLVGRPAGWTFIRPVGKGDPRYEERHLLDR